MDGIESVLVHITGSDIPLTPKPATPKGRRTSLFSVTSDTVTANGGAALVLPNAPTRTHATLCVSGTAGDTVVIANTYGEAQSGRGATVPVGFVVTVDSTDEVWLGNGTVTNTVTVGVIAEFQEA